MMYDEYSMEKTITLECRYVNMDHEHLTVTYEDEFERTQALSVPLKLISEGISLFDEIMELEISKEWFETVSEEE